MHPPIRLCHLKYFARSRLFRPVVIISTVRARLMVLSLVLAATLLTASAGLAAPISYVISAKVSNVEGTPFGTTVKVGDDLFGTVVFDPDSPNPFSALSFQVGANTYEMTFDPGTVFTRTNGGRYILGYNIGSQNAYGNQQWLVNGSRYLVDPGGGANGAYYALIWDNYEDGPDAPSAPTFRALDSPFWERFRIQLDSGYDYALFSNTSITSSAVPEPSTMAIFGLGALGMAYRARRKSHR